MPTRKTLIVGNWKMHGTVHDSSMLLHSLNKSVETHHNVEIVLCPPMLSLQPLSLQVNHRRFKLGAQNCYWRDEGAYTGEVSAAQLRGLTKYVIVGHSERRHVFHERERDIRAKVQAVVRNGMTPILCVGETASEYADKETRQVIHEQLVSGLANLTAEEVQDIVIAYEPVWAIGTGKNAAPGDVSKVAKLIRSQIGSLYGKTAAAGVRILYGGSVTDENAEIYLGIEEIDGLLPGGISLNVHAFARIVDLAHNKRKNNSK